MKINKVDFGFINDEAKRIEEQSTGINYMKFEVGETIIRLLPPFNARGRLFRKVSKHFSIPPENEIFPCVNEMWPDLNIQCQFCYMIDKIQSRLPKLEMWRQAASSQYLGNVIVRDHEDEGIQTPNFTNKMYNWIIKEMRRPQVGDVTDIERGIDLCVTKSISKRRDGKNQTKYDLSWCPRPTPLSDSDEQMALWLSNIPDLDKVITPPTDDQLENMARSAKSMFTYFISKYGGESSKPDFRSRLKNTTNEDHGSVPNNDQQSQAIEEDAGDRSIVDNNQRSKKLESMDPNQYPPCFAGLDNPEPHEAGDGVPDYVVGTVGIQDCLQKCLICLHDIECGDYTKKLGGK